MKYIKLNNPNNQENKQSGRKIAWMSKELLTEIRDKKHDVYKRWKVGQVTQEEHRDTVQLCRDGVRKAKAHLDLNLATATKCNKKGVYNYINSKRKARKRYMSTEEWGRRSVSNERHRKGSATLCLYLSLRGKTGLWESEVFETRGNVWSKADFPSLEEEDQVENS